MAKTKRLYYLDKLSIRQISKQTGISRNTVRTQLRELDMRETMYPA